MYEIYIQSPLSHLLLQSLYFLSIELILSGLLSLFFVHLTILSYNIIDMIAVYGGFGEQNLTHVFSSKYGSFLKRLKNNKN